MFIKELYLRNQIRKNSIKVSEDDTLIIHKQDHSYGTSTILLEVTDSKVQSQLYEVFKNAISTELSVTFKMCGWAFEITDYYSQFKKVKWFTCKFFKYFDSYNEQDKDFASIALRLFFAERMFVKGFKLNETLFNPANFNMNSVQFLVCFEKAESEEEIEKSRALLIQYLHYAIVRDETKEFFEFYKSFDESGPKYTFESLPYDYFIVKICYNYCKNRIVTRALAYEIEKGRKENDFAKDCVFIMKDKLNLEIKEETDEYVIYSNGYKIFKSDNSDFETFLKARSDRCTFDYSAEDATNTLPVNYDIHALIDFNTGKYIGYKMEFGDLKKWKLVLDFPICSQRVLFDYISQITQYCRDYNSDFETEYEPNHVGKSLFELEKKLLFKGSTLNNLEISVPDVEDLYRLKITDSNLLKQQIIVIFFKLFDKYITEKYGKLSNKREFLSKTEIRYLPPRLVHEFVKYCLGSEVNFGIAIEELINFFKYNASVLDKNTMKDRRFFCSPEVSEFVFDYELGGIQLDKNTTQILPDGRRLVLFSKNTNIYDFAQRVDTQRTNLYEKLGKIQDSKVHYIESASLVINTKRLNNDGFYNCCGYITKPIKATQMSLDILMTLNNRELLKVAGYLFTKFERYFIELKHIWMTENFEFYIDYINPSFRLSDNKIPYIVTAFKDLFDNGYNPNAFAGLPYRFDELSKKDFIDLANKMDEYCDEHKIFFNSKDFLCPICKKFKASLNFVMLQGPTLVFEDSIAKHYRIKHGAQIFKRYKSTKGLEQIEANIDKTITDFALDVSKKNGAKFNPFSSLNNKVDLFQDCFRPVKKVLDSNNRFVGYIYDNVSFATDGANAPELCVDLTDTKLLKNLPRLKSLIRLILQVKKMMAQNYGFAKNPFPHVFLNTAHKKQVQILNVDFVTSGIDKKDTEKWTYDYVLSVLQSDTSIDVDCNNIGADLDSVLAKLNEIASTLTKYCSVHKNYYQNHFMYCPKCIKPGTEITDAEIHRESDFGTKFEQINEGGEAFIYSYVNGAVIKIFKSEQINYDLKMVVLHRILGKKRALKRVNNQNHKFKFVYPMKLVKKAEENVVIGYIMEKVENAYPISNLRDKVEVERMGFSNQDIFEILITIGEGIEILHKEGIFVGDLNGRNILFDKNKNVYFLDFDGMGVDEISPEFCTDEYIDPVSKKNQNITKSDDWYSFAVQAFYYLTYTHPFNGIYYEEKNGKKVRLDVLEKMEKRISLLGKHGMKPPEIARSWDWMTAELKSSFLNIFEGQLRESIVPYLRNQYETLFSNEEAINFSNIYRVNQKFIAKEVKVFDREIVKVVNPTAAVFQSNCIEVLVNDGFKTLHKIISFSSLDKANSGDSIESIDDVKISDDGKYAYVLYNHNTLAIIDLQKNEVIYQNFAASISNVIVNGSTVYFNRWSIVGGNENQYDLQDFITTKKVIIEENGTAKEEEFKLGGDELVCFAARFNSKFVLIKEKDDVTDEIYCNNEFFCEIKYNSKAKAELNEYKILYDEATKIWLVINSFGKGVIIYPTGKGETIEELSKYVNIRNLENIEFHKGNLYIPNDGYIDIFNVRSKVVKKMKCDKVMTSDSMLCNINSLGFSVITSNVFYDIRKG